MEGGQEVNAWLIIGSDDTVIIRVAQSEMGQGVFTSMPMLVAEELACDWTKVRAEYASANRSLRQNRVYQRMATGGSRAVRASREYLQQAGASARARLIAAAASNGACRPASARPKTVRCCTHCFRAQGELWGRGCRCRQCQARR